MSRTTKEDLQAKTTETSSTKAAGNEGFDSRPSRETSIGASDVDKFMDESPIVCRVESHRELNSHFAAH